jgi:ectoine hydroxylase-related dioxygenase (phytanoyl-CoA dioxygenase family)
MLMQKDTLSEIYQRDGYVVLSDLFSFDEKAALALYATEIERWPETPKRWMQYFELSPKTNARQLCRTENFIPYHEAIRTLLSSGKLSEAAAELVGESVLLYKDKINFKLPGGNGFAPHQDAPAYTDQGQKRHVTALITVDRATMENGCLEMVKGGHKLGALPHTVQGGSIPDEVVNQMSWTPLELAPGDVVFFDSYLPHRSGPNLSTTSRRAFYITYNPKSEGDQHDAYYQDKRQKFPPECEREPGRDYSEGAKIYNLANPIR